MSGNLDALKAIWSGLSGPTYEKLAAVNAMTEPGPKRDVSMQDIENYLTTDSKIATLHEYVRVPPPDADVRAVIAANYLVALITNGTSVLVTSHDDTLAHAVQFLAAMTLDPRTSITAQDGVALLAMANSTVPWWQAHGFDGPVNVNDLIAAGNIF